jgi:hypothetical protein
MPTDHSPSHDAEDGARHTAGAFDIRTFIGALIGIYGVVLMITGLVSADGRSINLLGGAGMILGALSFFVWARWRPVVVPDKPEEEPTTPVVQ